MMMFQTPTEIQGFDKRTVKAYGRENVTLQMRLPDGRQTPTRITNVWYIPNSFISMEIINHYGINIYAPSGSLATTAPQLNGRFCLDIVHATSKSVGMDRINVAPILAAIKETGFATTKEATEATLRHRHLCHLGPQALKLLLTMTDGIPSTLKYIDDCNECLGGKCVQKPSKPTSSRAYEHLELVHSDLCGPLPESIGGGKYMLLVIDDTTRDTSIYILRKKSEALSHFKEWKALKEKESGHQLMRLRTDNGGEFTSSEFTSFLATEGIRHVLTAPYSSQSNGIVEHANRTIMDQVRCMLADAGFSEKYWGFAANAAVYLKNRSPASSLNGVTPYQARTGQRPSLKHLGTWGCLAFAHVPEEQRKKLRNGAQPGIFVGYCPTHKMYNVYDPIGHRLIRSRDGIFHEDRRYTASTTEEDIALMDYFKFRSDAMAIDPFAEFDTPGPVNKMYQNVMEILRKVNDLPSSPRIPLKLIPTYIHRSDTPESALTDEDELLQQITQGHDESLNNNDFTEAPEEPQHLTVSSSAQPTTLKRDAKSLKSKLGSYWTTGMPDANTTRTTRSGHSAAWDTGNLQDTLLLVVEDEETDFANRTLFALAANIQPDHPDGITDPRSYNKAMDPPYAEQLTEGMNAEHAAMEEHGVFGSGEVKLLELPVGRKALPSHWVLRPNATIPVK
jgi:hypothetical protein